MDFTRYIWALYAASAEGRSALAKSADDFKPLGYQSCYEFNVVRKVEDDEYVSTGRTIELDISEEVQKWCSQRVIQTEDEIRVMFGQIVDSNIEVHLKDGRANALVRLFKGGEVFNDIEPLSLGLHKALPDYFLPLFFRRTFDNFRRIGEAFAIPIAPPPLKSQKRARALYYLDLNQALRDFRLRHDLSPTEMLAFLYDFAPRVVQAEEDPELPAPSSVWFTIAGTWDFEFLDKNDPQTQLAWQGSADAKRGDIVLMYYRAPRSHIGSICRVMGDGYVDPFFLYHNSFRVGHVIKIPPVGLAELSAHPTLSENTAVRQNFQGAAGRRVSREDYLALLEILKAKSFDTSLVLIAADHAFPGIETLRCEEDVKSRLVVPLLKRLGYVEADWVRQMPLRMGRGERNYPDFAVLPKLKRGDEGAAFLIEAKYEIGTRKALQDAFVQAKSYALRLQARAFLLAAKEGLWLYRADDAFAEKRGQQLTWRQLEHPDQFFLIAQVLSKANLTKIR